MDYIDEMLVDHLEDRLELEELDLPELNLIINRINELAIYKALHGFESELKGRLITLPVQASIH
jgi:hypothetical protein